MPQHQLNILYQDKDVVAVDKPPGLLTVPGRGVDKQDCLINRMLAEFPNSRIVHRLDMATSGIVLVPQTHASLSNLSKQFQVRTIKKRYQALVSGLVATECGVVDLPLICDWPNRPRQKVCMETGKQATTEYNLIEYLSSPVPCSRVELVPVTGRSHQLRVHMQALGHPILGDYFYGSADDLAASERLLLHACFIEFVHPRLDHVVRVDSKVPF